MPNIPKPKRHLCHFWYVPNCLCTQYPVFPSYLTPCFILKTADSSKGTCKSELNMPHSNYDRSSYKWNTDPARNEKCKVNHLCKQPSVTSPPPLPEVQEGRSWRRPLAMHSPVALTSPEHSNLAENPTLWPHSNTSAKARRQPHDGSCTDSVIRKSYFSKASSEGLLWTRHWMMHTALSSVTMELRNSLPQAAHPHVGRATPALQTNATTLLRNLQKCKHESKFLLEPVLKWEVYINIGSTGINPFSKFMAWIFLKTTVLSYLIISIEAQLLRSKNHKKP